MTLVESLPLIDGFVGADAEQKVVFWSRGAEALFGYSSAEARKLGLSDLFDPWPAASELVTARRRDGSTFVAEVTVESWEEQGVSMISVRDVWGDDTLATIEDLDQIGAFERDLVAGTARWSDEVYRIFGLSPRAQPPSVEELRDIIVGEDQAEWDAAIDAVIRTHQPGHMRFHIRKGGKGEVRALAVTVGTITDSSGRAVRLVGTLRDVTEHERTARDRETLERQLEETRRIATLGRVAATMAHEFNNVMMGINTFVEVLKRKSGADVLERAIRGIENGIKRGRTITDEILRYTRASKPAMAVIDVEEWLADFTAEAQAISGGRATVSSEKDICIRGDISQLNQVLVNLIINARDASPAKSPITIEARRSPTAPPPGMVEIIVADRGSGIRPELLQRVFDPLFTTKPRGTGLGLAVVQQVIGAHGGTVEVSSKVGVGTEFRLCLPLVESGRVKKAPVAGSLLLVDDDPGVAAGLAALLSSEGLDIRVAAKGSEVLREIDRHRPDVIVMDLNLPDVAGATVYDSVAERWPGLPVIFMSGSLEPQEIARHLQQPHAAFLTKPFDIDQLLSAITRVLVASRNG